MIVRGVRHASSFPKKIRSHIAANVSIPGKIFEGLTGYGPDRVGCVVLSAAAVASSASALSSKASWIWMIDRASPLDLYRWDSGNLRNIVAVAGLLNRQDPRRMKPAAVLTG
jgi:hypothetical protein